jgi:hypothetical protein
MDIFSPDETRSLILNRAERDRNRRRLVVVYPALHGLCLDGGDPSIGTTAKAEIPMFELTPRLKYLAHVLGVNYTYGRGDEGVIWDLVEDSIMMSVALSDFPDAREIFLNALREALKAGRQFYPVPPQAKAPGSQGTLTPEQASYVVNIFKERRERRLAERKAAREAAKAAAKAARETERAAAPKRPPGRPPKPEAVKAAETTIRTEFARRRFEAKQAHAETMRAFDDAEVKALRLVRQGVDVLAPEGAAVAAGSELPRAAGA